MSSFLRKKPHNNKKLSPKIKSSSTDKQDEKQRFIQLPYSLIKQLGWGLAGLYSEILGLSHSKGYCYASTAYLSQKLGIPEKTIKDHLKILEDKKLIYRNTWHYPRGKKRHIIPHECALKYFQNKMCKSTIKKEVRDNYIANFLIPIFGQDFFKRLLEFKESNTTIQFKKRRAPQLNITQKSKVQIRPSLDASPKSAHTLCITKVIPNKETSGEYTKGKTPPLFKEVEKQKISRELIEKELSKLKLDWKKGWTLYECCKKEFDAYKNPIAGLVSAIKGGYADEKINKAQETVAKEKEAIDKRETKAKRRQMAHQIAQAIQDYVKEQGITKYLIYVDDQHATIGYRDKPTSLYLDYGEPETSDRLMGFAKKNGIEINLKEKENE